MGSDLGGRGAGHKLRVTRQILYRFAQKREHIVPDNSFAFHNGRWRVGAVTTVGWGVNSRDIRMLAGRYRPLRGRRQRTALGGSTIAPKGGGGRGRVSPSFKPPPPPVCQAICRRSAWDRHGDRKPKKKKQMAFMESARPDGSAKWSCAPILMKKNCKIFLPKMAKIKALDTRAPLPPPAPGPGGLTRPLPPLGAIFHPPCAHRPILISSARHFLRAF